MPGGDRAVKITPPSDMTFRVGSRSDYKVRDSVAGQDLTVYIPGDRFVANMGDELAVVEQVTIEEVVALEEPAPPPAEPEPAPVAEAAPQPEPPPPPPMPAPPPPPPAEETPWLLIIGLLIVVIVIAVIVMRRRKPS